MSFIQLVNSINLSRGRSNGVVYKNSSAGVYPVGTRELMYVYFLNAFQIKLADF